MADGHRISLSEKQVTDLILSREDVIFEVDDLIGKLKLENLTSLQVKVDIPAKDREVRTYTLNCRANYGPSLYRVRLIIKRQERGPYTGELFFINKHTE